MGLLGGKKKQNVILGLVKKAEKFIAKWKAQALTDYFLAFQDKKKRE